jgi:hypothetical protein
MKRISFEVNKPTLNLCSVGLTSEQIKRVPQALLKAAMMDAMTKNKAYRTGESPAHSSHFQHSSQAT